MVYKYDFLVIGAGVAGMSYALKVAQSGKGKVALICKTTIDEANTDKAQGGVSDILAKWLDIGNVRPVEGDEEGYLRIGELGYPVELEKLVERAERQLHTKVRAYGNLHQKICKVAVCGGAGGEFGAKRRWLISYAMRRSKIISPSSIFARLRNRAALCIPFVCYHSYSVPPSD